MLNPDGFRELLYIMIYPFLPYLHTQRKKKKIFSKLLPFFAKISLIYAILLCYPIFPVMLININFFMMKKLDMLDKRKIYKLPAYDVGHGMDLSDVWTHYVTKVECK